MTALPKILQHGKTPEEWVAQFAERGVQLSPRTLREKARQLNAFCSLGNAMFLKPEHIDRIFEESSCHLKSINEAEHGGSVDELTAATVTSSEALRHLKKQSQKQSSGKSSGKPNNVRSLAKMRQRKQTS